MFACSAVESGYEPRRNFAVCDVIFSMGLGVTCLSGGLRQRSARVYGAITRYNRVVGPEDKVF